MIRTRRKKPRLPSQEKEHSTDLVSHVPFPDKAYWQAKTPDEYNQYICKVYNPSLYRYYAQRYRLFSLYDQGVLLDEESWYSVTPEKLAAHHAKRLACDVLVDAFCGCGGNAIQFALTCHRVIAIDVDPLKICLAKHNAAVYGILDRIEFICGDYFDVIGRLSADAVFASPPWGGPEYNQAEEYDLDSMMGPNRGGRQIFEAAQRVTPNIALYVPRNTRKAQLAQLAPVCEIEENYLAHHLKACTAYYGDLIRPELLPPPCAEKDKQKALLS